MRTFTDPRTLEALGDDRYHRHTSALLEGVYIHPRDWFEAWGHDMPAKWEYNPLHGRRSRFNIYPHYTKDYGWEWITEERFKWKYGKRKNETKNENVVVG